LWRRLEVRSDQTLDQVHTVVQDAFCWDDYHLHRFALGTNAWDRDGEVFVSLHEVDDPDTGGTDERVVRLDETMAAPGDVLHYVYDYGDNWDLTLRLEQVAAVQASTPVARCTDGRRAAPPEDCGGLRDADDLAQVLADPARFDPDDVNARLDRPVRLLARRGLPERLVELVSALADSADGADLAARLAGVDPATPRPGREELAEAFGAHLWFLRRAGDGGIPLTAAGWLRPADVTQVAALVPSMGGWIGKTNREDLTWPVARFRQSLTRHLGLLRKYKGRLLLTKAGAAVGDNPDALFTHIASRLVAGTKPTYAEDADPVDALSLRQYEHNVYDVLRDVSSAAVNWLDPRFSPVACALARAALNLA